MLAGLAIVGADSLFAPLMPAPMGTQPQPSPWQGLLASLYGGITEEVLMRLGLATLLAWGASRVLGTQGRGRLWALGLGIAGATLLFGAGHLPAAAMVWPLTPEPSPHFTKGGSKRYSPWPSLPVGRSDLQPK